MRKKRGRREPRTQKERKEGGKEIGKKRNERERRQRGKMGFRAVSPGPHPLLRADT